MVRLLWDVRMGRMQAGGYFFTPSHVVMKTQIDETMTPSLPAT